jgi:deoxyribodipyrimidine photo-lyase
VIELVWFKRDLRAVDHAALAAAAARGTVLPMWIVEPEVWHASDAAARQYAFHAECAGALGDTLAALGQPLVVRTGEAVAVLSALQAALPIRAIHAHQETTGAVGFARDRRVRAWARAQGIAVHEPRQGGVVRGLASRDGWARQWEAFMRAPPAAPPRALAPLSIDPGAIPDAAALGLPPDHCPGRQPGGRVHALRLLDGFLAGRGRDYRRAMSSPLAGEWACSRLSAHFAAGSLSVREAYQAAHAARAALADEPDAAALRDSIASFVSRLAWHCHFTQKLESEPALEHRGLHPALRGLRPDGAGSAAFDAWAHGRTGWPFVDACMRSLIATGWLNFRMRAMLVSVATCHLWMDWRAPGRHLARLFTDYEPGIHWPQMQMQAAATGVNTVRLYNPVKQGFDQDPCGTFIRRWVPELAALEAPHIHTPWLAPAEVLAAAGVELGQAYPHPIADHEAAARAARDRLWGARRGIEYARAADAIQDRHGSRRSGMRQVGDPPRVGDRPAKAARRQRKAAQGALEL